MHDLFILPTLGENYGHVIVEAWAAGVPVLLSDQTPWRGLSGKRIGWDFPLSSPHLFHQALMTASQWSGDDWMEIKSACVKEAGKIVNNSGVIEDNRLMLRKAMGH
jgi:glycosyltransferase involved in cell wall biosynthesis